MKSIFRNKRKSSLGENKFGRYVLYAIGEIFLIITGILIAVSINESVTNKKEGKLRCLYLNELLHTFNYDIKDVEGNIIAFDRWNPRIAEVAQALENKNLTKLDSLDYKLGIVGNYIFFGQRSKTKIEELKYNAANLIEKRELKNKILLYQDQEIMFIRTLELRYDLISENLRQYYTKNFSGFNYGPAIPNNIEKLQKDSEYASLVNQRLKFNKTLKYQYKNLLKEQEEIKKLIEEEINNHCGE